MPDQFADLLTVGGLTSITVLIVAILKRLEAPEETPAGKFTAWIKANQFLTSLVVAFTLAAIAYAVREAGYLPYAEHYWQGALFLWAVAQALYNGQKGLARIIRGDPN